LVWLAGAAFTSAVFTAAPTASAEDVSVSVYGTDHDEPFDVQLAVVSEKIEDASEMDDDPLAHHASALSLIVQACFARRHECSNADPATLFLVSGARAPPVAS
jgi:hypothetical protein